MSNIIQTGFEQIKTNLIASGFEWNDPKFTKTSIQKQEIQINGQPLTKERKLETTIEYIGEGSVDDEARFGFCIFTNNEHIVDIWAKDWVDFVILSKI